MAFAQGLLARRIADTASAQMRGTSLPAFSI